MSLSISAFSLIFNIHLSCSVLFCSVLLLLLLLVVVVVLVVMVVVMCVGVCVRAYHLYTLTYITFYSSFSQIVNEEAVHIWL